MFSSHFFILIFFNFTVVDTQLPDAPRLLSPPKKSSEVLNETIVLNYVLIFI